VLVACEATPRADTGAGAVTAHDVPGSEADLTGAIPALDVLVGVRGSWHLVWVVSTPGQAGRLFYARGEGGGQVWTSPRPIADHVMGRDAVRILQTDAGLHVLFDKTLRHLLSRDAGITWQEQEPFVGQRRVSTDFFDAVTVGDQIVAIYLTHPRVAFDPRERTGNADQVVYAARWSVRTGAASAPIASFPASLFPPLAPRLVADSQRLHLLCAIQAERRGGPSVHGKLYYLRSDDAGVGWSEPVDVLAAGTGAPTHGQSDPQAIQGIEIIVDRHIGGIMVLYADAHVYVTESPDGRRWSPPVRVSRRRRRGPGATYGSRSVGAATADSGGRIVWIDTSHRRSDRSWLNPLGGFPWSDDPDWSNNDIMMLPLGAVRARVSAARSIPTPERLTPDQSFVRVVRVRASADSWLVVWSGRRKVGRRLDTYGERPRLFFATPPM
jgi:hypothetical protein